VGDAPDLVTLQLRYPRFIHAEFMTHRVFSRNASSSRAIPVERMIEDVIADPAMPVAWGSNKPGMQAGEELPHWAVVKDCWLDARDAAVTRAYEMMNLGAHKQIVNRILEPFAHISVIVTATDWGNFFALRCHPDADPTIRALAEAMRDAIAESEPETLQVGDWHLPYIKDIEFCNAPENEAVASNLNLAMVSAARCARVSYLNHDGSQPDIGKDLALADKLLASKHMSPFEHQARLSGDEGTALWGNLRGWDQFRKMVE
jgi:thymidylate synthase ThyX